MQTSGFGPKERFMVSSLLLPLADGTLDKGLAIAGGAIGMASSNGTSSPSIIQPDAVDDVRV